jgi:hypothetical protein
MTGNPPSWNKTFYDNTFLPFERVRIQQSPLTRKETQDSTMWMFSENGDYLVKA